MSMNIKFNIDDPMAIHFFSRSNMDFSLADVKSEGATRYVLEVQD